MASRIVASFPAHACYVEPFGGSAAVMLAKPPSKLECFNDKNQRLVNFFRVLRDPKLAAGLEQVLKLTPFSRLEFEVAKEAAQDPVEDARRFMVLCRQSYAGKGREWMYSLPRVGKTRNNAVSTWQAGVAALYLVHQRLLNVQIECLDWRLILQRYDAQDTLFFLDPPYHPETRVSGRYQHEMSAYDHEDLIERLLKLRGLVVLCGYSHAIHCRLESAGWQRIDHRTITFASDRLAQRTECLWISPSVLRGSSTKATPADRLRDAAYRTHAKRVASTTRRIERCITTSRSRGEPVSKSAIARKLGMSREHLTRSYGHLFTMP